MKEEEVKDVEVPLLNEKLEENFLTEGKDSVFKI